MTRWPSSQRPRSRRFVAADVHPARAPRRTRLPCSVVYAASCAKTDRDAIALLAAPVQQRLVRVAALRDIVVATKRITRRALIVETLDDIEGGSQSLPEVEFVRLVRRYRLPTPTRQRILRRANGRYYLDADWDEYGVSAEIDGIHHEEFRQRDHDRERRNDITADGRRVLNFVSYEIRHVDADVAELLARSLRTGGWRG